LNDHPCILIVYSTFGDGHVQTAKAIRQSLASQGIKRVFLVDLLAEAHPYWNALSRFTYLQSSVYFPKLYGFSYDVTNQVTPDPHLSRAFHSLGKKKLMEIVEQLKPDAVIHTFPYLAMSELSAEFGPGKINTYTVITDYVLHSRWVHPDMDRYFVATEQLKEDLRTAGIEESRISVSGIPLRESFDRPVPKEGLHSKLRLDPRRKYALISAGAYGVQSHVRKMIQTVLDHSSYDILLICGKNRKLLQKMEAAYGDEPRIRVMGFVEHIEEWMAVSSCLLTKAGAITLTEALSLSLPVIVYRPIPGQERGNADVLSEAGALFTAADPQELADKLRLVEQDAVRRRMVLAMKSVFRPHATEAIVSAVLQKVTTQPAGLTAHTARSDALRWRTN
jgi:processive 1,2-diacylglycerol beta-glucosyltransferase